MDTSLNNNGKMGHALEDIVLSWTPSTIKDEQPVKTRPQSFSSSHEYLDSYKRPLIEETRSTVVSSMDSIHKSQHYRLLSITEEKNSLYFLDIDPSCNDSVNHVARNGDLFLLSTSVPEDFAQDNGGVFVMAVDITPHEYFSKSFYVMAKSGLRSREFKYVIFLCNIMTNSRIWKTLHFDMGSSAVIKNILQPSRAEKRCNICIKEMKASHLPDVFLKHGLNSAQQHIALLIASKMKCNHSHTVEILLGPPRTGKTKIVSTIVEAFKAPEAKILVCAPMISSFSPLCSSMLETISTQPIRYKALPAERIGDAILLCGIEDEVMENSITEMIQFCIGYRLREIMPCMMWKSKTESLISFLVEGFRKKAKYVEEKLKEKAKGKPFLLQLLKEMLERKLTTLMELLKTIWRYVPTHIFSQDAEKGMAELFDSMDKLKNLVQNRAVTEEDIKYTFNLGLAGPSTSSRLKTSLRKPSPRKIIPNPIATDIRKAKDECVNCLKYMMKHTRLLPSESDIESLKKFFIQETPIILATPSNFFDLHGMGGISADMLFVEGANHIKECELLIPLSLPSLKHAVLSGDQSQVDSTHMSKVDKNSAFGISLLERLISQGSKMNKLSLSVQYKTDPLISFFPNKIFYKKGEISNASCISSNYLSLDLCNYAFINIEANKEAALIFSLLNHIVQACKIQEKMKRLEIGVLCSWTETSRMVHMQDQHGQLNVTIRSINSSHEEEKDFDILILSTAGFPSDDCKIKYALSRASDGSVIGQNATWKALMDDAKTRGLFAQASDHPKFSVILDHQKLNICNLETLGSTLGLTVTPQIKPAHEFTWVCRRYNGILMLPPVRDQRAENHCTLCASLGTMEFLIRFRCASLDPPIDCMIDLLLQNLLEKYNALFIGIGEEEGDNNKGVVRLENMLEIIKTQGAISGLDKKVYTLSSYARIYDSIKHGADTLQIASQEPRKGNVLIGTFKLSMNYNYCKPGEIYEYNPKEPILHPLTDRPASHAVMVIGGIEASDKTQLLPKEHHFVMQNSHGRYFGQNGIGRVRCSSIRHLYKVTL
ncbi:unnamed protein product [Urochloa decumbens]|uniref:RNA helicase n=1 Tax=Urochloa decumbens TaxID=240449 RepID=A0ABC9HGR2_9POAL